MPAPRTSFDWGMYSQATFAGLSPLIPIPILDWVFEAYFRNRLPQAVARSRGRKLDPAIAATLNRSTESCLAGCWLWPFWALVQLIKSLSKKILYVLSIAEATEKLSYYWHQAFLIETMLASGYLDEVYTAQLARFAMDRVMRETSTSPLVNLASQMAQNARHTLRSLLRARSGEEDEAMRQQKVRLIQRWEQNEAYLLDLATRYERVFQEIRANPPIPPPGA